MTKDELRQRMLQGTLPDTIWDDVMFFKRNGSYQVEYKGQVVVVAHTMKEAELEFLLYKVKGGINV